ncbi:M4 family metallopeptidase, partial [Catenulispora subtropica]|uniref:M4 family metallopeptidase n=1 Tax=Catenulispora subtropica TaxID=450798 RepID=UPI003CD096BA
GSAGSARPGGAPPASSALSALSARTAAAATDHAALVADQAAASGFDALAKGPDESYVRTSSTMGTNDLRYFGFERTYKGLPVVGGDAVVVTDAAGNLRGTTSAHRGALAVASTTPKVTAARAAALARAQLTQVSSVGAAKLVVLATGAKPVLAWEVLAVGYKGHAPSHLHVYVDAGTGAIADTKDDVRADTGRGYYDGTVSIDTTGGQLQDPNRQGLSCGNENTGQTYPNGGTGAGTDLQTACVDAYYTVEQETNMLRDWLGRNGLSGNGQEFPLYVGLNDVNAYWDGSSGHFGHTSDNQRQATSIDVVGHEMGHSIFQYTPGGAGSGNENGGINESTGDIFGALTEHYANNPNNPPDYVVGLQVNLTGTGPIRYMYNPSLVGDPNCYSSSIPGTEVHSAAGPNNHWFYLVAVGSAGNGTDPASPTCNNSSVSGVGIQHAGQIYMAALNMKTSSWTYKNVRTATLQAAVNLFGAGSQDCKTVKAAWDAVSVGAQPGEAQCSTAPSNDFSVSVSPTSGSVAQGSSVSTTVSTAVTAGSAQQVTLTASGLPSGVTASFNPATVTAGQSSTLTLTASSSAATGSKAITITGTAASGAHTATYTATVTSTNPGNDFSVNVSPGSATVAAGSSTTATVSTATVSGSAQTVALSVAGAPTGVTASVSPASVTSGGSATLNVAVASTTAAGTYTLTVTGTGSATHTASFVLTVTGGGGGGGCAGVSAWSSTASYVPGDKVTYGGHLYKSTWYSTGAVPSDPQSWAVWSDAGAC